MAAAWMRHAIRQWCNRESGDLERPGSASLLRAVSQSQAFEGTICCPFLQVLLAIAGSFSFMEAVGILARQTALGIMCWHPNWRPERAVS